MTLGQWYIFHRRNDECSVTYLITSAICRVKAAAHRLPLCTIAIQVCVVLFSEEVALDLDYIV